MKRKQAQEDLYRKMYRRMRAALTRIHRIAQDDQEDALAQIVEETETTLDEVRREEDSYAKAWMKRVRSIK